MSAIGIIVPVYKVEQYIHRCLDSILNQTYDDFKLILVDDGSPDNCPVICDAYAAKDSRIHVIHQKNGGLSVARNSGIDWLFANSNCQWLTFIDSDDWVPAKYLELLLNAAKTFDAKISMCWLYPTAGEVPALDFSNLKAILSDVEQAYTINGKEISAYVQGRLYARECFSSVRFPVGRLFEDIFTTHKIIFEQQYISVIEAPLYYYYTNQNGIVNSVWTLSKIDMFNAMEEQIAFFEEHGFTLALRMQIRRYLLSIQEKITLLSEDKKNNAEVIRILKSKRKKNLCKFSQKLNIHDHADAWALTKVFPKRMWIYWHLQALKKKFRL